MECNDSRCPKHGTLSTRGMVMEGVVVSDKMYGTVIVQKDRLVKVRKYERYKRSRSKIPAHNPPCINAKVGDKVRIMECRRLSKTVNFVVTEKIGVDEPPKKPAERKEVKRKAKKKTVKKKVKKKQEEVEDG